MKSVCIPIVTNQYILCKKLNAYKICETLFLSDINNESISRLDKFLEGRQKNNLRSMMTESKLRVYILLLLLLLLIITIVIIRIYQL